jgi:hypothetical protein
MKPLYRYAPVMFGAAILSILIWAPNPADANVLNGRLFNTIAGDIPAKHALTHKEDIDVANHCADGGGQKDNCLCLVKVLKHELTIRDYRAIATRIRPDEDAPRPLSIERYRQDLPLTPLDPIISTLLTSPDLSQRCETADQFYSQQTSDR